MAGSLQTDVNVLELWLYWRCVFNYLILEDACQWSTISGPDETHNICDTPFQWTAVQTQLRRSFSTWTLQKRQQNSQYCILIKHNTVQNPVIKRVIFLNVRSIYFVYCKSAVFNFSEFKAPQKQYLKGPVIFVVLMMKAAFHFFHRN